jgi:hypothetical protein
MPLGFARVPVEQAGFEPAPRPMGPVGLPVVVKNLGFGDVR